MSDQPDPMIVPTNEPVADRPDGDRSSALQHITVDSDDEAAVCTMFPQSLEEADVAEEWLTATGDSFVALEDAR